MTTDVVAPNEWEARFRHRAEGGDSQTSCWSDMRSAKMVRHWASVVAENSDGPSLTRHRETPYCHLKFLAASRAPLMRVSFGGLAVEMLFCGFGLGLGRTHRSVTVLWRRIEGIELQRLVARVHDIVPGSRRHDDRVVALDL